MSNLRNCRRCGKLYVYTGRPICGSCIEEDEQLYKIVREYIEKHPRSTTFEVAEALDISVDKILQFLREGKLELSGDNINMLLECERCGKPIRTGRFCPECSADIEKELKKGYTVKEQTAASRNKSEMYMAHRRKK
ncbi:MAG: flagellar protein [Firmicutes bacterium]|nr:flagellar protein [Bacillota bacterium]MDI6707249.1 MerR family transcriptional regulator [Bacillota bacterium]